MGHRRPHRHRVPARDRSAPYGNPLPTAADVIGYGVNHAFHSDAGRFRTVERIWTADHPEGPEVVETPQIHLDLQKRSPDAWEWFNLAGPDFDLDWNGQLATKIDLRPTHRLGDEFIAEERSLRDGLAESGTSSRLRDALVLIDLLDMLDTINDTCEQHGLDIDQLREPGALRDLHSRIPTRNLFVDLRTMRLQDPGFPLEQHDRTDLLALVVAICHCDVVVTERRWAHFAHRASAQARYSTAVLPTLNDLWAELQP